MAKRNVHPNDRAKYNPEVRKLEREGIQRLILEAEAKRAVEVERDSGCKASGNKSN